MPLPIVAAGLGGLLAAAGAMLSRLVFSKAGGWIIAAFAYLGIALVAHEAVMDPLTDYMANAFGGLTGIVAEWVGFLNVDKYASLVLSGYIGGTLKRVVLRKVAA